MTAEELEAVKRLALTCETAGGQDLKLVLRGSPDETARGQAPGQFLAVAAGEIMGYVRVDDGQDVEICGMVHPHRRQAGIGTALLDSALQAAAVMGRDTALVICEDAAPAAIAWMRRRGGSLDMSELRMVLSLDPAPRAPSAASGPAVALRRSTPEDRPVLRHLLKEGFPETDDEVLDRMLGSHDTVEQESLIAWDGKRPVGTMRLLEAPGRAMVYGLVIDRALRGQGFGGAAMREALELVRARGTPEVSLEVLPDNEPAVRLYTRLGFTTVTTYRYMRVATGRLLG